MTGSLEVTNGSPDDEELAAVVIALSVIAARAVASEPPPGSRWRTSIGTLHPQTEWRSRS